MKKVTKNLTVIKKVDNTIRAKGRLDPRAKEIKHGTH